MSSHLKIELKTMCMSQNISIINIGILLLLFFSLRQQQDLRSISNRHLKSCSLNIHQYCHLPESINAKKVSMGTVCDSVMTLNSVIPGVED